MNAPFWIISGASITTILQQCKSSGYFEQLSSKKEPYRSTSKQTSMSNWHRRYLQGQKAIASHNVYSWNTSVFGRTSFSNVRVCIMQSIQFISKIPYEAVMWIHLIVCNSDIQVQIWTKERKYCQSDRRYLRTKPKKVSYHCL